MLVAMIPAVLRLGMQRLVNLFAFGVLNPFLKLREIAAQKAGFGNCRGLQSKTVRTAIIAILGPN